MLEPFLLCDKPTEGAHLLSDYMVCYFIIVNNITLQMLNGLYFPEAGLSPDPLTPNCGFIC